MKDVLHDHFIGLLLATLVFFTPPPLAWAATALFVGRLVWSLRDLERWSFDVDDRHLAENRERALRSR